MYLARTDASARPQPGNEIYSAVETASGQGAGKVVMSAPSPHGGYEILAVIENGAYAGNSLHLNNSSGPQLEILSLPYVFEE
jgi:hypothetical protein